MYSNVMFIPDSRSILMAAYKLVQCSQLLISLPLTESFISPIFI